MRHFISLILSLFLVGAHSLFAHEEGAPFSGAIIEPLVTHHAHVEDEQKVNMEFVDQARLEIKGEERELDVLRQSLELAWGSPDFRWGAEIILPFSNEGEDDGRRQYGPGDLEIWFPKIAWINQPERILTTVFAVHAPTASESQGLGSGKTLLEGKIFFDQAYHNWFLGANLESSTAVSGGFETGLEYAAVISYSLIRGTKRVASPRPDQPLVLAPVFEVLGEVGLGGASQGESSVSFVGGLYLWHPKSGWSVRVGYRFPVGGKQEEDRALLAQFGNHLSWPGSKKK